ncbi:MAG: hypothetical protein AAGU27_26850 [Dehalobacterium sp.]
MNWGVRGYGRCAPAGDTVCQARIYRHKQFYSRVLSESDGDGER